MSLLAATQPIVVERDGTDWWIPFATALFVAFVAALASYYATWRFKKGDVNRENAFRAAGLVDRQSGSLTTAEVDTTRKAEQTPLCVFS
jgi:hypothetical protein